MPKGPKGKSSPSPYSSPELFHAKPKRKALNVVGRRALQAAAFQLFVQQHGRRAHAGHDPNDRWYRREECDALKHLRPDELDRLLRDGED